MEFLDIGKYLSQNKNSYIVLHQIIIYGEKDIPIFETVLIVIH